MLEFHNLRAKGAFLVSATLKNGKAGEIRILSEAGSPLKIILPWESGAVMKSNKGMTKLSNNIVEVETEKGELLVFNL